MISNGAMTTIEVVHEIIHLEVPMLDDLSLLCNIPKRPPIQFIACEHHL
jgi:hypothetical protein